MFVVIYQGYIKPGREEEYQEVWNKIACYFVEYRGALGSCLHRAADGCGSLIQGGQTRPLKRLLGQKKVIFPKSSQKRSKKLF